MGAGFHNAESQHGVLSSNSESPLRAIRATTAHAGEVGAAQPEQLKPFQKAGPEEQLRRAREVLRAARILYKGRYGTLQFCIRTAGAGVNGSPTLEGYYAERLLRPYTQALNLGDWEGERHRRRVDVFRALDAAIKRASALRGGWFVTVGGRDAVKFEPPRFAHGHKRGV